MNKIILILLALMALMVLSPTSLFNGGKQKLDQD